jgi:23S rRNA maturation mini-RNase III
MKTSYHKQIEHLENTVKSLVNLQDQQRIFIAVDSSFRHIYKKKMQIHKFLRLIKQQEKRNISDSLMGPSTDKFVKNLSNHILTESEKAVLKRGLNFALTTPQSNLDMACAVESIKTKT